MDKWKWDEARRCFYKGQYANQKWCLPENMPSIAAAEAFEEAAKLCLSELEYEASKEKGGGHLSSLSAGYSEACEELRKQITDRATALRAGAAGGKGGMSETLKPCPFCGKRPVMQMNILGYWLSCSRGTHRASFFPKQTEQGAITAWNRRPSSHPAAQGGKP